uniref:Peptidoglycan bridge formation glycyltransferase FemA/FemB family protein n=1 Tax=candidate division WWE3 bacterium TaxID=2053526 RepID=A0A832DUK5_UNCKA
MVAVADKDSKVGNQDLRQSDGWAKYLKSQGWEVEEIKCKIYIRKIPLFGSVVKIQRPKELPSFAEINRLAKKHRALLVKLEPRTASQSKLASENGFVPDKLPSLPTRTILIDLTKSERELWEDLAQDARQSIRKAKSYQLTVDSYQPGDKNFEPALRDFDKLLKETGRRQKFWTPSLAQLKEKAEAFGKDAHLFLVPSKPRTPLAGALILEHDGTHSASSKEGQKLFAPYFLLWEIIRYLQKGKKISFYDLAGIYDPRFHQATRHWQGFTTFKQKFGGKEVEYPAPLIKHFNPVTRILFSLAANLLP